jgi:hypothetical protein
MATTIFTPTITTSYREAASHPPVFSKFFNWCTAQNHNRLLWLGVILAAHGCILTPLTAMIVLIEGAPFALFMLATTAMGRALVTNLAAMPTKYTLPVFALSVLIDIAVVITTLCTTAV